MKATLLNLIPVDVMATQMVRISQSGSKATIFRLTNPTPPSAAEVARVIFRGLDLRPPVMVAAQKNFISMIDFGSVLRMSGGKKNDEGANKK